MKRPVKTRPQPTTKDLEAQIADLCETVTGVMAVNGTQERSILALKAHSDKLEAEVARLERWDRLQLNAIDSLKAERDSAIQDNSKLRHLLHESELDRERMRGYMDAVEDSRPPRMVEEKRERHFGAYTRMSVNEQLHSRAFAQSSDTPRTKAWFDK